MPFSVRCRYCRCVILGAADQLGTREAATIRAHFAGCIPNVGRWPHTIGELLRHLSVGIAPPHAAFEFEPLELVPARPLLRLERRDVLLVHRDDVARASLNARLGAEGFSLVNADDTVDALRRLYAGVEPCALLLDAHIRRDGAWSFASWLGHHPSYAHIPIIVLNADSPPPRRHVPRSVAEIVPTPIDDPALLAFIERHCRRARDAGVPVPAQS